MLRLLLLTVSVALVLSLGARGAAAVVYIDCNSVSCTPYNHAMVPQYDEVRVINAPVGATFNFNAAFMNGLTFDTALSNCNVQLTRLTLFNGHLTFKEAPTACTVAVDRLNALAGVVTFAKSLGSGTSLSVVDSQITVSTSSLLDPTHAIHVPDQIAAGTAPGDITITGNRISYRHQTPSISFPASGVWIGKFGAGPPSLTVRSNVISVENLRAYGVRIAPSMAWPNAAVASAVVIELNTIYAVHATQGSGIEAGAAYWAGATRLSVQGNTVAHNVSTTDVDADGSEFVGIGYTFCYVRSVATEMKIAGNVVSVSAASDYAAGIRFEHSGSCEGLSAVKQLDGCKLLDVSSNTVTVGATYVAVGVQLGAQKPVEARLSLGKAVSGSVGLPSGRALRVNGNQVVATGHHAHGIALWLWNVDGLDELEVSSNGVTITQQTVAPGGTLSVAPLDGSDARATGYGIHVAFNDRFSDVYVGTLRLASNVLAVASSRANSECGYPRTFWYDACWAELAALWVRWHATRAGGGGYAPRGGRVVYVRDVDVSLNTAAVTDAGGVFLRGIVLEHASMRDVTADLSYSVAYTRGALVKVASNVLVVASTSASAAGGLNSTLQCGVGFSVPLATYGAALLDLNSVTITSHRVRLGGGGLVAIASAFTGTLTASGNTLRADATVNSFHAAVAGASAGLLVVRAGDGANADTGDTVVSGNTVGVAGGAALHYFLGLGFVWSARSGLVPLLHPLDGGAGPGTAVPAAVPGLSAAAVAVRFDRNKVAVTSANATAAVTALALSGGDFFAGPTSPFALGTLAVTNNDFSGTGSTCDASPRKAASAQLDGSVAASNGRGHFFSLDLGAGVGAVGSSTAVTFATLLVTGNTLSFTTAAAAVGGAELCEMAVLVVGTRNNVSAITFMGNSFFQRHDSWVPTAPDVASGKQSVLIDLGAGTGLLAAGFSGSSFLLYQNSFGGVFASAAPVTRFGRWTALTGVRVVAASVNVSLSHNRAIYDAAGFPTQPLHFAGVTVEASGSLLSFDNNRVAVFGPTAATNMATYAVTARLLRPHYFAPGTPPASVHAPNATLRCTSDSFDVVSAGGQLVAALNVSLADPRADSLVLHLRNFSASAHGVVAQVAAAASLVTPLFLPQNLSFSTFVCERCYLWAMPRYATKTRPLVYFTNGWWAADYSATAVTTGAGALWFKPSFNFSNGGSGGFSFFATNVTVVESQFNNWCIETSDVLRGAFKGIWGKPECYASVRSRFCTATRTPSRGESQTYSRSVPDTRSRTTFSRSPRRTRSRSARMTQTLSNTSGERTHTRTMHIVTTFEPYPITVNGVVIAVLSLLGFTPAASILQLVALVGLMSCGNINGTSHDMRIAITPVWTNVIADRTYVPSYFWLGQSFLVFGVLVLHFLCWLVVVSCGTICHPLGVAEALAHSNAEQGDRCCVCDCGVRARLAALRVRFPHFTVWAMQWLLPGYVYESTIQLAYNSNTIARCISAIGPALGIVHVSLIFFWAWRASRAFYFGNMWVEYSRHRALFRRHWKMQRTRGGGNSKGSKNKYIADAAATDGENNKSTGARPALTAAAAPVGSSPTPSPVPPLPIGDHAATATAADAVVVTRGAAATTTTAGGGNNSGNTTPSKRNANNVNNQTPVRNNTANNNAAATSATRGGGLSTPQRTPRGGNQPMTPASGLVTPSGRVIPLVPIPAAEAAPTPRSAVPAPGGASSVQVAMTPSARVRQRILERQQRKDAGLPQVDGGDDELDFFGGTEVGCCDYVRLATLPVGYWATHKPFVAERVHTQQYGAAYDEYLPTVLPWAPFFESALRVLVFPAVAAVQDPCSAVSYPLTILAFFCFAAVLIVRPTRSGVLDLLHALLYLVLGISLLANGFKLSVSAAFNYNNCFYAACAIAGLAIVCYWSFLCLEVCFWRPEWERANHVDEEMVMAVASIDREFDEDIVRARAQPVDFDEPEDDGDDAAAAAGASGNTAAAGDAKANPAQLIDGTGNYTKANLAANKNESGTKARRQPGGGEEIEMESVHPADDDDDLDLYTDVGMEGASVSRADSVAAAMHAAAGGDDDEMMHGQGFEMDGVGTNSDTGRGVSKPPPDSGRASERSTASAAERVRQYKLQRQMRNEIDGAFASPEERRAAQERLQREEAARQAARAEAMRAEAARAEAAATAAASVLDTSGGADHNNNNAASNALVVAAPGAVNPWAIRGGGGGDKERFAAASVPAPAPTRFTPAISPSIGNNATPPPQHSHAVARRLDAWEELAGLTVDNSVPPPARLTMLSENRAVAPDPNAADLLYRREEDALDRRVHEVKDQVRAARAERLRRISGGHGGGGDSPGNTSLSSQQPVDPERAGYPDVSDQASGLDAATRAKLDRIGLARQQELARAPTIQPVHARMNPGMATWIEPATNGRRAAAAAVGGGNTTPQYRSGAINNNFGSPGAPFPAANAFDRSPSPVNNSNDSGNLSGRNPMLFSSSSSTNSVNAASLGAAFGRRAVVASPLSNTNAGAGGGVRDSSSMPRVTDSLTRNGILLRPGVTPSTLMHESRRDGDADVVTFD